MKLPVVAGQVIYTLGYPILRLAIFHSTRSYVSITCRDEILLSTDWLSIHHEQRLIGGGARWREHPMVAAIREAREEIGQKFSPDMLEPLCNEPIRSMRHFDYYLFRAELSDKPVMQTRQYEILGTQWVKRQDVAKYRLAEESLAALRLMGWL